MPKAQFVLLALLTDLLAMSALFSPLASPTTNSTNRTGTTSTSVLPAGTLSDILQDPTAIGAMVIMSLVVAVLIGYAVVNCYRTRKANEVYWQRVQFAKSIPERKAKVLASRVAQSTSWQAQNPLHKAAWAAHLNGSAVQLDFEDVEDIETVATENKAKWKLSALVAPTISKAAIEAAARQHQQTRGLHAARSFHRTLTRLAVTKGPKHTRSFFGKANLSRHAHGSGGSTFGSPTASHSAFNDSRGFVGDEGEEQTPRGTLSPRGDGGAGDDTVSTIEGFNEEGSVLDTPGDGGEVVVVLDSGGLGLGMPSSSSSSAYRGGGGGVQDRPPTGRTAAGGGGGGGGTPHSGGGFRPSSSGVRAPSRTGTVLSEGGYETGHTEGGQTTDPPQDGPGEGGSETAHGDSSSEDAVHEPVELQAEERVVVRTSGAPPPRAGRAGPPPRR